MVFIAEKSVQILLGYNINGLYKEEEKNEFTNATEDKCVKYYVVPGF